MKAIVLGVRNGRAALLMEDGTTTYRRMACKPGQRVEVPEENGIIASMPKSLKATAAVAALFLILGGNYFQTGLPVSYITMDVNPSMEYALNRNDRVVEVAALNKDAQAIVDELSVSGSSIGEAVDKAEDIMEKHGYLTEGGSILFSVSSNSDDRVDKLEAELSDTMDRKASQKGEDNLVYSIVKVSKSERDEAKKHALSAGRFKQLVSEHGTESLADKSLVKEFQHKPVDEMVGAKSEKTDSTAIQSKSESSATKGKNKSSATKKGDENIETQSVAGASGANSVQNAAPSTSANKETTESVAVPDSGSKPASAPSKPSSAQNTQPAAPAPVPAAPESAPQTPQRDNASVSQSAETPSVPAVADSLTDKSKGVKSGNNDNVAGSGNGDGSANGQGSASSSSSSGNGSDGKSAAASQEQAVQAETNTSSGDSGDSKKEDKVEPQKEKEDDSKQQEESVKEEKDNTGKGDKKEDKADAEEDKAKDNGADKKSDHAEPLEHESDGDIGDLVMDEDPNVEENERVDGMTEEDNLLNSDTEIVDDEEELLHEDVFDEECFEDEIDVNMEELSEDEEDVKTEEFPEDEAEAYIEEDLEITEDSVDEVVEMPDIL